MKNCANNIIKSQFSFVPSFCKHFWIYIYIIQYILYFNISFLNYIVVAVVVYVLRSTKIRKGFCREHKKRLWPDPHSWQDNLVYTCQAYGHLFSTLWGEIHSISAWFSFCTYFLWKENSLDNKTNEGVFSFMTNVFSASLQFGSFPFTFWK